MARSRQAGFTLIELIVVMAISSTLVVIALVGQRGLRSQAQFDADVDKVVASVAEVRNEATAGVNTSAAATAGTGVTGCGGGGKGYIFAGLAFTSDNAQPGGTFQVDYYEAGPTALNNPAPPTSACIFSTRSISLPSGLQLSSAASRVLFIRNGTGGLAVCPVNSLSTDVRPSFEVGTCKAGIGNFPYALSLQDADGHKSQIIIDQSGLAKRVN